VEHNFKNGLCFAWVDKNRQCPNKGVIELLHNNGAVSYGLFCNKHAKLKTKELAEMGIQLV